jgi:hypothetical protein
MNYRLFINFDDVALEQLFLKNLRTLDLRTGTRVTFQKMNFLMDKIKWVSYRTRHDPAQEAPSWFPKVQNSFL